MEIRQMQYILTLAEHRNFTKAAKVLYISQPSLSALVAKVEAELGVVLFDRSTSPLTLTYAGEVYVQGVQKILADCDLLEKKLGDIAHQKAGRIRLAIPHERAAYMLPALLPGFKKLYPKVEVQVTTTNSSQMVEMLLANKVDMAIMPNGFQSQDIVQSGIYSEELVIVGTQDIIRPEHLVAGIDTAVDISNLEDIPLITLSSHHGIRVFTDELFAQWNIRPQVVIETTSNITAYRLATAGLGAAIIPRMTIELTREAATTPVYALSACGTHWQVVVAQRKDAYISRLERDFISLARQVFNQ